MPRWILYDYRFVSICSAVWNEQSCLPSDLLSSAHPEMAIFRNICVELRILILEILNVFLWLKFSPALILQKISHFWMDTIYNLSFYLMSINFLSRYYRTSRIY